MNSLTRISELRVLAKDDRILNQIYFFPQIVVWTALALGSQGIYIVSLLSKTETNGGHKKKSKTFLVIFADVPQNGTSNMMGKTPYLTQKSFLLCKSFSGQINQWNNLKTVVLAIIVPCL